MVNNTDIINFIDWDKIDLDDIPNFFKIIYDIYDDNDIYEYHILYNYPNVKGKYEYFMRSIFSNINEMIKSKKEIIINIKLNCNISDIINENKIDQFNQQIQNVFKDLKYNKNTDYDKLDKIFDIGFGDIGIMYYDIKINEKYYIVNWKVKRLK